MLIKIPESVLDVRTSRSSGPGGQHVNTTESKVEIRFYLWDSGWLPHEIALRLAQKHPHHCTSDGYFFLSCQEHRSQRQNLAACLKKAEAWIASVSRPPKKRIKTKPSKGSREQRLKGKKHLGIKKQQRKAWSRDD